MESNRILSLEVSDRRGEIFARGCAQFETVRKARPEYRKGAVVRVHEPPRVRMARPTDRGEWMIRDVVPVLRGGSETGQVVLVLHRLADVYPGREGRAFPQARQAGLFDAP